jgi:molybdopterin converting factor small subunit
MPTVKFTYALKRFFPGLKDTPAKGVVLTDILDEIETSYPGISNYILDEQGNLRRHVNIFINGTMIPDRTKLNSQVAEKSEIYIIQALSGG